MNRLKLWGVLLLPLAMLISLFGATAQTSTEKPGGPKPSKGEITADVAVITLGNWQKRGEGSATTDLSGNTVLTIESGNFHTNGDLKVQSPSQLISDQLVTAKRKLICTNRKDPDCLPSQAGKGPQVTDPLSHLPGPPNVGRKQQWPSCNAVCTVSPGRYTGPYNVNSGVEYLLEPGYYRFHKQVLNLNGTFRVDPNAAPHPETGMGVMLYFESKSYLEIGSQGSLQFDPPEGGPYENVAIYYNRGNKNPLGWRASNNDMPGWVYGKNAHLRLNNDADWTVNNRFVFRTMNSQGGNYTIDPGGWSGWDGDPFEAEPEVTPIFECYVEEPDGTYTAYFGYENETLDEDEALIPISIALGNNNSVTPLNLDGVQPTEFVLPNVVDGRPGRTAFEDAEPNAFVVTEWDGSAIVWKLDGKTATANLSTNCSSQPPLGERCFGDLATIVGTDGDDVLVGTPGVDVIYAGDGNDVVDGLGGDDRICGADGEDVLNGDAGDDQVDGGGGHDVLDGGDGQDTLVGAAGDDVILGGPDSDFITGGDGDDAVRAGEGDDNVADNDQTNDDRDVVDGEGGNDACDVDLDDAEVSC